MAYSSAIFPFSTLFNKLFNCLILSSLSFNLFWIFLFIICSFIYLFSKFLYFSFISEFSFIIFSDFNFSFFNCDDKLFIIFSCSLFLSSIFLILILWSSDLSYNDLLFFFNSSILDKFIFSSLSFSLSLFFRFLISLFNIRHDWLFSSILVFKFSFSFNKFCNWVSKSKYCKLLVCLK